MSDNPYSTINAPNGPSGPAYDILPLAAPAEDVALSGTALGGPARGFAILTAGTVAVTTLAGNDRTFAGLAGQVIPCGITHVLSETTANLLLYGR